MIPSEMPQGSPNDSGIDVQLRKYLFTEINRLSSEITRLDAVIAKLKQNSQDYSLEDDPDYKKRHHIALSIRATETSRETLHSCIETLRLQTVVPKLSVGDFVQPVSTTENESIVDADVTNATNATDTTMNNKRNDTESGVALSVNAPKKFRRTDFADQTIHLRILISKMGHHPDVTKRLSVFEMVDKYHVCESAVYKYLNPKTCNERFACELDVVHVFESMLSPDRERRITATMLETSKTRKTVEGIVEKSAILALKDMTAKLWEEMHNPEPGWSVHMDSTFDAFIEPSDMASFKDILSKRWLADYRKEKPVVVDVATVGAV